MLTENVTLIMEFVPLKKYSADKKRKNSPTELTSTLRTSVNKKWKKSRDGEVEKTFAPQGDDIDRNKKSVVELLPNQISESVKEISEDGTNEKIPIPRLFVNMKRVIMNEQMVREIHPDIIAIRFPRKKRSRWCWAIFHNEKKAAKALTQLKRRRDIIVTKPQEQLKGRFKKKVKSDLQLKNSVKSKLKEAWM